MTAIVGFTDKKNNVTWIGSDSLGSNGFSKAVQANPKCFHNDTLKNVIMGSTSTFRHIDLLKYSETLFPEIDKYKIKDGEVNIDHRYMVKTFIPNLINLFQQHIVDELEKDRGANFLIGVDGKLFQIQLDYSVLEAKDGYDAVGCGEYAALGSLYSTTKYCPKFTPVQHITAALESAEKNCCGVQRPFHIINTKNDEVITIE